MDKESFVNAVMADVPGTDYDEAATKVVMGSIKASFPKAVLDMWNNPETRPFIGYTGWVYTPPPLTNVPVPHYISDVVIDKDELNRLADSKRDQNRARFELRIKIDGAIRGCATLKQALAALPGDLHKYLPQERRAPATKNVPVCTGLLSDLKVAGWVEK